MKDVKEFVEKLVHIEYINSSESYGHFPFQMFTEESDGTFNFSALAVGGIIQRQYNFVKEKVKNKSKRIYLSLDFPAGDDIERDFVCVFSIEDGKFENFAIPYDPSTGEKFEPIKESNHLSAILEQFKKFVS